MYCIGFAAVKTNYYFGGRLVKSEEPGSTWYQADQLGSHGQHHPYGEQRAGTTWQDPGFATYWRESSGLDYAVNRHYSSTFGRFTSADPYRASGGPADPASWNRYGYVGGDPVNFVDPEGLVKCGGGIATSGDKIIVDVFECIGLLPRLGGGGGGGGYWGRDVPTLEVPPDFDPHATVGGSAAAPSCPAIPASPEGADLGGTIRASKS